MNFLDLVKKRYSVRDFQEKEVEAEKIDYLLEVARWAPSAVNFQPWKFIVISNKELLSNLYECYDREWFKKAPLCIVICGDHHQSWHRKPDGKDHCDIDIAIATDHLTLAAAEQGLGSCWVCNFDAAKCSEILKLPEHLEPIVFLPLGYINDSKKEEKERNRKEKNKIVEFIA